MVTDTELLGGGPLAEAGDADTSTGWDGEAEDSLTGVTAESGDEAAAADPDPVQAWRASDAGRQWAERQSIRHADQLERLARRAVLDGDAEAMTRLQGDKVGRRLLALVGDQMTARVREQAQSISEGLQWYEDVERKRQYEPGTFGDLMGTPEFAQRYHQWQTYKAGRGAAPAAQGGTSALERAFDRLRGRASAQALSEDDWDRLHPDNFAGMAPDEAIAELSDRYAAALAGGGRTRGGQPPDREDAIRRAAGNAPPIAAGAAARGGRGYETVRDEMRALRQQGAPIPKNLTDEYEAAARRAGLR